MNHVVGLVADGEVLVGCVPVAHAEFLHDATGGGVDRKMIGGDVGVTLRTEGELDDGEGGFGGKTIVPIRNAYVIVWIQDNE